MSQLLCVMNRMGLRGRRSNSLPCVRFTATQPPTRLPDTVRYLMKVDRLHRLLVLPRQNRPTLEFSITWEQQTFALDLQEDNR